MLVVMLEGNMRESVEIIRAELERTREQIADLERTLSEKPDYGLGEGDPGIVRWEMDQALLRQSRDRVEKLEQALLRLDQGTYGKCERCGETIHPDRLSVLPDARLCIRCARQGKMA